MDVRHPQCDNGSMSKRGRARRKLSQAPSRPPQGNLTPRGTEQDSIPPPRSHWALNAFADSHTLGLTIECVGDIATAVARTHELAGRRQLTPTRFQRECRHISTPVRKLILPSSEELLKRCFTPMMHPLKPPERKESTETLTQWIGNSAIEYSQGEETDIKRVSLPSEHEHKTVIGPLYGLSSAGDRCYRLEDPFDRSATPLRLGQWLNLKVLQVDDITISSETLLRSMANKEGAHSELDQMATSNPAMPVQLTMGDPKDEPYRRANIINFGGISYVQLFTFLVGFYLARVMKATLEHTPDEFARFGVSREACLDILQVPTRLISLTMKANRPFFMGFILENTDDAEQPFKMVGNYETPSRTVVKIP